ncbi:hypothetical protein [Candidatus Protochlamydia phocaeensis]|uniref:hypothetical protein n=1 Tax=Candidatus Protochlamydia phocaeensis TaxID=1414722 RepID=UPI000837D4A0|nr:hypothetical protein [Candidatus Protochlamydia phocaeensis]
MRIKSYLFMIGLASALSAASLPFYVAAQAHAQDWAIGQQWVEGIEKGYQSGRYASILKQIDETYQQRKQEGAWQALKQQAEQALEQYGSEKDLEKQANLFKEQSENIKKETNQKLLEIAKAYPQDPVAKIIEAYLAAPTLSPEQKQALIFLNNKLIYSKEPASSPLLKQCQEVALEYHFKRLIVQVQGIENSGKKLTDADKEAEEAALNLQKFDRLEQLASEQGDDSLLQTIQLGRQAYLIRAAYQHNQHYLAELGRGKKEPETEAEKEVAKVMRMNRDKTLNLMKQYRFLP